MNEFDCIVVGAGPSGTAAAYTMAKEGLNVLILERGAYPGAKNMFGGVLYANILMYIIPDFCLKAPIERKIVRRRYSFLSDSSELALLDLKCSDTTNGPFRNAYTILRARFDKWFAAEAEAIGVTIITDILVDDLVFEGDRVVGVKAVDDKVIADVVILAEGANSILREKAGLQAKPSPSSMAIGAKEVINLPRSSIEERFNLVGSEGASYIYLRNGDSGLMGGGFISTNIDSVSIGVVYTIQDLVDRGARPNDIIESFKLHPCVAPLIADGETREYSAHMVPKAGYHGVPQVFRDGVLAVGDAAGFVNPIFQEGLNLAMASGVMAGMTVFEARQRGDFSAKSLAIYRDMLEDSFVLKDLKLIDTFKITDKSGEEALSKYLSMANEVASDVLSVGDEPKAQSIKCALARLSGGPGWFDLLKFYFRMRTAIK